MTRYSKYMCSVHSLYGIRFMLWYPYIWYYMMFHWCIWDTCEAFVQYFSVTAPDHAGQTLEYTVLVTAPFPTYFIIQFHPFSLNNVISWLASPSSDVQVLGCLIFRLFSHIKLFIKPVLTPLYLINYVMIQYIVHHVALWIFVVPLKISITLAVYQVVLFVISTLLVLQKLRKRSLCTGKPENIIYNDWSKAIHIEPKKRLD